LWRDCLVLFALLLTAGCSTYARARLEAVPPPATPGISAAPAPAPIPADKKLHWGWTLALIVVVVLVVAFKHATDFDWDTEDSGDQAARTGSARLPLSITPPPSTTSPS
jgi:hypothetical protein